MEMKTETFSKKSTTVSFADVNPDEIKLSITFVLIFREKGTWFYPNYLNKVKFLFRSRFKKDKES